MAVARLHTKLFEAAALDMDRQIRSQFMEQGLRPDYLNVLEKDLKGLESPDFGSQLGHMLRTVDAGADLKGRFRSLKSIVGRVLRPFTHHEACVNRMTIERLAEMHGHLTRLTATCKEMHESLREEIENQADTLRGEFAEELRGQGDSSDGPETAGVIGRPIPFGAKLLVGPVAVKRPGYVHIDPTSPGSSGPDRLPVTPGTAAEVVVANVLELFPAADVRDRLLPYWASLLQPRGRMTVIADDLGAAGDRFRDGDIDLAELAEVLFGDGGAVRRSAYTPEVLREYVLGAGLIDVSLTDRRQWPEARAYGFELAGYRPAA